MIPSRQCCHYFIYNPHITKVESGSRKYMRHLSTKVSLRAMGTGITVKRKDFFVVYLMTVYRLYSVTWQDNQ
jgi:hypothetical protein